MTILGIETSHRVCSVGVVSETKAEERTVREANIHSEHVLTLVESLCNVHELDAVAVSVGPGSFTGLRIGLSTAKGLCVSLDIPLIAVPTFRALALQAVREYQHSPVALCLDAKQGDYYCGLYDSADGDVEEVLSPTLLSLQEALQTFESKAKILIAEKKELFQHSMPETIVVMVEGMVSGKMIADVGRKLYAQQQFADIATIEPYYLKDFLVKPSR